MNGLAKRFKLEILIGRGPSTHTTLDSDFPFSNLSVGGEISWIGNEGQLITRKVKNLSNTFWVEGDGQVYQKTAVMLA